MPMQLGSTPLHFVTGRFGNRGDHLQEHVRTIVKTLISAGVNPAVINLVSMYEPAIVVHYDIVYTLSQIICALIFSCPSQYGYTVMHESIMWSDSTSLSVMLDQSTAQHFERLLLIVSVDIMKQYSHRTYYYFACRVETFYPMSLLGSHLIYLRCSRFYLKGTTSL